MIIILNNLLIIYGFYHIYYVPILPKYVYMWNTLKWFTINFYYKLIEVWNLKKLT